MPATISSWMWAVWAKTYGQNANRIAAVAAPPPSPVKRRTRSQVKMTDAENAIRTTALCAAKGLWVAAQIGTASVPAPILASEKASARRCG